MKVARFNNKLFFESKEEYDLPYSFLELLNASENII